LKSNAASETILILLLISVLTFSLSILSVESEGAPLFWNYMTGDRVYSVSVSSNNKYVVAGSDDRNVYSLNLTTGQKIWNYNTGEWSEIMAVSIFSVFISPDNKYTIAGTASNIYCFNTTNGNKIWNFTTGEARSVFVSPDSKYVVAGSHNGYIYSLNITNGNLNWAFPAGGSVFSVFVSPDNQYIFAGYADGVIALDAYGHFLWNYYTNGYVSEKGLFVSPDSRFVIAGSVGLMPDYRGRIYALNITNGQQIWNYTATGTPVGGFSNLPINSVSVSSDSKFVVAGTGNGNTPYINMSDGHLVWNYSTGDYDWDVSVSPNDEYVVVGGNRGLYCLSSLNGNELWRHSASVTSVFVSSDSQFIVAGSWDHKIYAFFANAQPSLHDIGITNVSTAKTVVGQGYNLSLTVNVINYGNSTETFNLTVYAETATILVITDVVLANRSSITITLAWNTSGFAKGNYTTSAYATPVSDETNTTDNTFVNGWVIVAMVGDVTGPNGWSDGKVDIRDVAVIAKLFGTKYPEPSFNPNYDINSDGKIDIKDIAITAKNFGKIDP